jgi:hypothetical protein
MKYFEDDSYTIPDYIKKMSHEEKVKKVAELEAQARKERDIIRAARKKASA